MSATDSPFRAQFLLPHSLGGSEKNRPAFNTMNLPTPTFYFDYAAATPIHKKVLEEMLPWMTSYFANAAARIHPMGEVAENALSQCRSKFAEFFKVNFEDVIFLSSATEANNFILRGLVADPRRKRRSIVIGATEHASIYTTALALEKSFAASGICVKTLPVDDEGQIDLTAARTIIDADTLCVCVMDVNNETGVLQSRLQDIIELAHSKGAPVHVDGVQGFARGSFETRNLDFDSVVVSGAKIYGPKGAAGLVLRKKNFRWRLEPQLTGGGHEFDLRSSTPNIPAIVGLTTAFELQENERTVRNAHLQKLEVRFLDLLGKNSNFTLISKSAPRVPGIFMGYFPDVNAMKLIEDVKNVCVSVGSACRTLQATASHVCLNMGVPLEVALASFRVSLGLPNTIAEVELGAKELMLTATKVKTEFSTGVNSV